MYGVVTTSSVRVYSRIYYTIAHIFGELISQNRLLSEYTFQRDFQAYKCYQNDFPGVKIYYRVRLEDDIKSVIITHYRSDYEIVFPGETLAFKEEHLIKFDPRQKSLKRPHQDDSKSDAKQIPENLVTE